MKRVYKILGVIALVLLFSSCNKTKTIEEYDKAFTNSNFANCSVTYSLTGEGVEGFDNFAKNFKYDNNKIEINKEIKDESGNSKNITYYSYNEDNVDYLVFKQNIDNEELIKKHSKSKELDQYFYVTTDYKYFNLFYKEFGFENIRLEKFTQDVVKVENNRFVVDNTKVAKLGKYAFGDYSSVSSGEDDNGYYVKEIEENYDEISFEVKDDSISKIIAKVKFIETKSYSDDVNEVKEYDYTYQAEFFDYGKINIQIPDAKEYIFNIVTADIYDAFDGEIVRMNDVLVNDVNTLEKYVYICDILGALPLDVSKVDVMPQRGQTVSLQAYVRCYGALVELEAIELEISEDEPTNMINLGVDSFNGQEDTLVGEMVEVDYLTLKTKDIQNLNVVFTTYDDEDVRLDFISSEMALVDELLKDVEVGAGILLKTVAVSMDKTTNNFTLKLLDSTELELADGMIFVNEPLEFYLHTELEEVLSEIQVINFENGVREVLSGTDLVCESNYDKEKIGTELIKVSAGDNVTYIPVRTLYEEAVESYREENGKGVDYAKKRYNMTTGLPSTGDVDILVIPIGFTNEEVASDYKTVLEKAFNGTSEDTGWESLKSYYYKSSFGKLNFNATILDVYETNDPFYTQKNTAGEKTYPDDYLGDYYSLDHRYINEALAYYEEAVDYSKYDVNNDGVLDCVYFIYMAPYDNAGLDIAWAYTTVYYGEDKTYDDLKLSYYLWMSYEFFFERSRPMAINCETVIHETGHALGLDDYYDTTGETGGYGGGAMMAANVGDHEAYSKAILGWINPYVVINSDTTLTIDEYEATGDAIFIAKDYDGIYFNEYYIIDYYTPTGLNEIASGQSGIPSIAGIRIIKVNAVPSENFWDEGVWAIAEASNSNAENRLIYVYEAYGNEIIKGGEMNNKDLFQAGSEVINLKWADGTDCNFTIKVVSIEDGKATIQIDFN